ncbi:IS200/IS605 family transposase [Algivirga pacifica]|uniref:IS200/IS605 family transposase n=1 Tax=Algivirga pacifica TaxID=1162670 RepID=A0ABP9DG84_9BACT
MSQSLVKNYIHLVYSTKKREAFIHKPFDQKLYIYIYKICEDLGVSVHAVGGHVDHIHILCELPKNMTLIELLQKLKGKSSKWFKTLSVNLQDFYWQNGYASFSINPQQKDIVIQYIHNQEQHHQNQTFKEELLYFLKKYQVEYDEKYLWD